jgi:hypothetical protein
LAIDGTSGLRQHERRADGVEVAAQVCREPAEQPAGRGCEHLVEAFDGPSPEQSVQPLGPGNGDVQRLADTTVDKGQVRELATGAFLDAKRYLQFSQPGGQLLFHLIQALRNASSLLITTNFSFADWPQVFGYAKMMTGMLDRLPHHCDIFETGNPSWRFKNRS